MRFSTLALLVALPAAAYATLSPQQLSVRQTAGTCALLGEECDCSNLCCEDERAACLLTGTSGVCSSVSALPLADWYVSGASSCSPQPGSLGCLRTA